MGLGQLGDPGVARGGAQVLDVGVGGQGEHQRVLASTVADHQHPHALDPTDPPLVFLPGRLCSSRSGCVPAGQVVFGMPRTT